MSKTISEILLRSTAGIVPYAGPFLNMMIDTFIPDQRLERLEKYQEILALQLSALSEDYLYNLKNKPLYIGLIEQGYKEAVETSSNMRQEFIANLVISGISKDNLDIELTSQLFRILKDITNNEVILLRHFASRYESEDIAFKTKFDEIIKPIHVYINDPDPEKIRREALRENSILTLRRLNLIDSTLVSPKENDRLITARSNEMKYKSCEVTHLGRAFLEYLDMLPEKSS